MLLLSDASLFVVLNFLQILLWICIPALLVAMLITTLLHYNKKKRLKKSDEIVFDDEDASFDNVSDSSIAAPGYQLPGDEYAIKDLLKRLFSQLSRSNARYIAIRKDLEVLNKKYNELQINIHNDSETIKKDTMETIHTNLQQPFQEQMENMRREHELEKKELHAELNQLTTTFESLEKDNYSLRDQLAAFTQGSEAATVIQSLENEKTELRNRISEQEYLKEVLEERKLQISFLQQQLEQRIKNHHLIEQQFRELGIKLMEAREELEIKRQLSLEFQSAAHEKEQEIGFLKEVIQLRSDNEVRLETIIKELREQNEKSSVVLENKEYFISDLQDQLTGSNEQKKTLEDKLEKNQMLIKSFHRKLSELLEEEMPVSPVIVMKPVFKEENINEQLTESVIQ